jgi:outer membrane protein
LDTEKSELKKLYIIMKLIKLFFIAAGLTLTANTVNAQQKIGSVNTEIFLKIYLK